MSEAQDEFDVDDHALVPDADVHEAAELYNDVEEPDFADDALIDVENKTDVAADALMSVLMIDVELVVENRVDESLVFVLLEFFPFSTLLERSLNQSSIDLFNA